MSNEDFLRSEGDLNTTSSRRKWDDRSKSEETHRLLREDAKFFIHQSLSTPCLDVLKESKGASITTVDGKTMLDFHGNYTVSYTHLTLPTNREV